MRRLAVFARAPVAGRVKTRLSPALPAALSARLYAGLLGDTFAAAHRSTADERLAYWADEAGSTPVGFTSRTQQGENLGERLANAFAELLVSPTDRVLITGSDTPALTPAHLDAAFAALDSHDVVLGPARDGGYWCIGLSRGAPELFRGIPWSTGDVFARTLEIATAAGSRVATAVPLDDLDTTSDLATLVGVLAAGRPACGTRAREALVRAGFVPPTRD